MLRIKKNQNFLASLFASVYIFVALFSQSFHEHGSGEVFKDFHFTKADKTITSSSEVAHYADCLSCHVLHQGKYVTSPDFSFSFFATEDFQVEIFRTEKTFMPLALFNFAVRGPPLPFI